MPPEENWGGVGSSFYGGGRRRPVLPGRRPGGDLAIEWVGELAARIAIVRAEGDFREVLGAGRSSPKEAEPGAGEFHVVREGWERVGRRHLVSREAAMTALERAAVWGCGGVMRRSSALGAAPR